MRNRLVLSVLLLAMLAVAALWLRPDSSQTTTTAPRSAAPISQFAEPPEKATPANAVAPPAKTAMAPAPPSTDPTGTFRVDHTGKLIVDEQTRLNMEALFARTDPADLPKAQEDIIQNLPPMAAAQASTLIERYQNYSKAQRQAYPPGTAPATEEAALAELDGLHALRVAHFGSDVAQALFGAEETLTRSLIELMRLEKDQGLTLEEKAARAQQLYDTLPGLSRVQRSN
jgi:lipase chaperone LimK